MDWSKTTRFVDRIDSIYYQAILTNFEEWHDPSCPIIPDLVVDSMIVEFEVSYPLAAHFFSTLTKNTRTKSMTIIRNNNKRHIAVVQFLSMARIRNSRKLTWWALVESLSLMARGIPKAATSNSVMNRQALPYQTAATKLNGFAPLAFSG